MTSQSLPLLNKRFHQLDHYQSSDHKGYTLLPFRFIQLDDHKYVSTNMVGEYVVLSRDTVSLLVNGKLKSDTPQYDELRSKHFILENGSDVALDLYATKYRTKYAYLGEFTALHIFVVSLRCDHICPYCQVSRVSSDKHAFDMSNSTADKAIEFMFRSPCKNIKVEFQGGESLLNFPLIKYIVNVIKEKNKNEARNVEFVIATNLSIITDEILSFCKEHEIYISTSLDGPRDLHNANRHGPNDDSYERAIAGILRVREALGPDSISALMTTTKLSLQQPEAIVDEYIAQGFRSIFFRWLSPFGFAVKAKKKIGYSTDSFNQFYERGLRYIININLEGLNFRENFASIILQKMLTTSSSGYVDLQSPSGLGISVIVYNYDGNVFASDESRMLAETDDNSFRLGNLHKDTYEDLFFTSGLADITFETMTEGIPCCSDCAFEPYCGTDPVFHYATQGDVIGHRPTSDFCKRNMHAFRLLFRLLEDKDCRKVLESWV